MAGPRAMRTWTLRPETPALSDFGRAARRVARLRLLSSLMRSEVYRHVELSERRDVDRRDILEVESIFLGLLLPSPKL